MAVETISLEFIAAQLGRVLDEQRAIRIELRRLTDNQAGLLRLIDGMNTRLQGLSDRIDRQSDDLAVGIKVEIGGLFANLETA